MSPDVKPTTVAYPRRSARSRENRDRILGAARALFEERGYVGATIQAIADRADVSCEAIYAKFGNKRSLLEQLLGVTIAGDADGPPVLEQGWVQELRDEPERGRRIALLAANGRAILERRAALDEVVRGGAAADPDIAELRDRAAHQRFAGQRELLRILIGSESPRPDLDTAADVLYSLGSPETFRLLVVDRGWTPAQFEQWYADAIGRLLFD